MSGFPLIHFSLASNNSLFAVPANQEFVYINTKKNETSEPVTCLLNLLKSHFSDAPKPKPPSTVRKWNNSGFTSSIDGVKSPSSGRQEQNSFKEFLWQHIDVAFTKGFDDNVGRNAMPARFEVKSSLSPLFLSVTPPPLSLSVRSLSLNAMRCRPDLR